jgi:hypothetical protein
VIPGGVIKRLYITRPLFSLILAFHHGKEETDSARLQIPLAIAEE